MINLNQLRIFYYAAKHQSFTLAAHDLFITQPAVTAQVKTFEESCGLKLFKKRGRRVYLADEGRTLFQYAQKIFDYEKRIENALEDMRELKRGILRIGTTKAYARYFMPLLLSTFHEKYPNINIELNEGSSLEMSLSLLELKNEVAIIAKTGDMTGLHFIPFSQEEMVLIVAPDHRLACGRPVTFKDLTEEPFIMKDKGSGTRRLVDRLFSRDDCTPNILMEVSNAEFIKQLVQRGEGISYLVHEAVAVELAEKKLAAVPLKDEKIYLDVSIAYLKGSPLSPPAKAFVDILEKLKSGREMMRDGIGAFMAKILSQQRKSSGPAGETTG